jgi:hypothetical protein
MLISVRISMHEALFRRPSAQTDDEGGRKDERSCRVTRTSLKDSGAVSSALPPRVGTPSGTSALLMTAWTGLNHVFDVAMVPAKVRRVYNWRSNHVWETPLNFRHEPDSTDWFRSVRSCVSVAAVAYAALIALLCFPYFQAQYVVDISPQQL